MTKERELERVLKALANRRRLAILKYIKTSREASVGEIAEVIRLSLKATSKHLAILAAAGILERDQRSNSAFYRVTPAQKPPSKQLIAIL